MLKKVLTKESIGLKRLTTSSLLLLLLFLTSCSHSSHKIEPKLKHSIHESDLKKLPPAFSPLTNEENSTDWGKEYQIGQGFGRKLDLYRAITALQRAEILAPSDAEARRLEISYETLLCYYLGKRYTEVDATFTNSALSKVSAEFPAFHDLLVILYDSYVQMDSPDKADHVFGLIEHYYPDTHKQLLLSSALMQADFSAISSEQPFLLNMINSFLANKKSEKTASILNAAIPGTGYLYLRQTQTGITALLVNALFILGAILCLKKRLIPVFIILLSFEAGWYFGGISGGAEQAKYYNERLYESLATPLMNQHKLFPIFRIDHGF